MYRIISILSLFSSLYAWDINYVNISEFQYNTAIDFISKINIHNNDSILDVGCGNGRITKHISDITSNKVLGVDSSEILINYANNNYKNDNLKFMNLDINHQNITEYIGNNYDNIVSFFCIPWVKNKTSAFINMASSMKNGGKLYILAALFEINHVNLINNLINKPQWKDFYNKYESPFIYLNDSEYEKYSNISGLSMISKDIYNVNFNFNNRTNLRKFNLAILPHVKQLPENYKNKFVDELLDDYVNFVKNEDYIVTFTLIKFLAYKK
ncbi:unknown similar to AMEV004 [Adoxophyes honmai entomopoxvirus 'L']|uniref:Methyltransferase domain-containing protein n=1 Tax=Adoxophyes honmai entomopoxvirus 'L' TaxID=1293540 RepID=A0A916KP98_9POXV|nr:unknown similar to AMEV004 [Adoxophyes honmai entomopoxvirus 'L']CCU55345.1 unknown similar to AMEV004 [Adoxophyes honmai entomopoxvirus 'L']